MAHITASVEYGMHCLLWLAVAGDKPRSGPDLATFEGVSPSFLAKILMKLQKAGVVRSVEGVRGGYLLARPSDQITLLEVVDAIEGRKPLFDCQEIRGRCALLKAPARLGDRGVCSIHAAMLKAEKAMRNQLASETLADIANAVGRKAPANIAEPAKQWFDDRETARTTRKPSGQRRGADRD